MRHMAYRYATAPSVEPAGAGGAVRAYLAAVRESAGANAYAALLGLRVFDTPALHHKVEHGLAFAALLRLGRLMAMPLAALGDTLQIPPRTLQRRKAKGRLEADESDRLLRLTRLYGKALELFEGDNSATLQWLRTPRTALGGKTPLAMSTSEPGAHEVEHLIGRLEHGVIA